MVFLGAARGPPAKCHKEFHMSRFPKVTIAIVVLNLAAYFLAEFGGAGHVQQIHDWAFVPESFWHAIESGNVPALAWSVLTMFTSTFVHEADLAHVGFNMIALLAFGRSVEERLGAWRYLTMYFVAALCGHLFYASMVPDALHAYGASTAVMGTAGAYFILLFDREFRSSGWVMLLRFSVWLLSLLLAWLTVKCMLDTANAKLYGFTPWVHFTGYVAGIVLAMILLPKQRAKTNSLIR